MEEKEEEVEEDAKQEEEEKEQKEEEYKGGGGEGVGGEGVGVEVDTEVLYVSQSDGWSVLDFLIFQIKKRFESTNSNLSNTTNFILLDSLLQEVTMGAMYICISLTDTFLRIQNLFTLKQCLFYF